MNSFEKKSAPVPVAQIREALAFIGKKEAEAKSRAESHEAAGNGAAACLAESQADGLRFAIQTVERFTGVTAD